jgi:hypothetical protein
MARLNTAGELWRKLTEVAVYRIVSAGGSTTASGAITVGQQTIAMTATTGFTSADPVIFSGDLGVYLSAISAAPGTASIVTTYKAPVALASGANVWQAVKTNLGHPTEEGPSITPTFSQTAIRSAIRDLPLQYISGQAEIGVALPLLGFSIEAWQSMFGIPESVTGAGTSGDPYQGYIGGNSFGTQTTQVLRMTGNDFDGNTILMDFNDAKPEASGSTSLNRTAAAALPLNFKCSSLTIRKYT